MRGTHLHGPPTPGRITLTLDAGLAFGSGEHGSTRGCLRALERVAHRRPRRILDLGTGSGILAMAAARLLHRPVLATDIEPWSVRVAQQNATLNRLGRLVRLRLADGWRDPAVRAGAPYDLVFANILARPLCLMARHLAAHLAPGGTAILSGLLQTQARAVTAAHRRCGLASGGQHSGGPLDDAYAASEVGRGPQGPPSGSVGEVVAPASMTRRQRPDRTHAADLPRVRPISASSRSVSIAFPAALPAGAATRRTPTQPGSANGECCCCGVLTTVTGGSSYR